MTAFGFLLFGVGLAMSCVQTRATDYDQMFWPQVVRGFAVMFCILPPTRLALGSDTVAGIEEKHRDVERELDLWRAVSLSTDFVRA